MFQHGKGNSFKYYIVFALPFLSSHLIAGISQELGGESTRKRKKGSKKNKGKPEKREIESFA